MRLKSIMPSSKDIKSMSTFFYAFSDDTRLKIIILLTISPLCVTEISNVLNVNQTTVSHQLKILKSLNIVEYDRNNSDEAVHSAYASAAVVRKLPPYQSVLPSVAHELLYLFFPHL